MNGSARRSQQLSQLRRDALLLQEGLALRVTYGCSETSVTRFCPPTSGWKPFPENWTFVGAAASNTRFVSSQYVPPTKPVPGSEASFGLRRQAKRDAALDWMVRQGTSSRALVGERSQSAVAAGDRCPPLCRRSPRRSPDPNVGAAVPSGDVRLRAATTPSPENVAAHLHRAPLPDPVARNCR